MSEEIPEYKEEEKVSTRPEMTEKNFQTLLKFQKGMMKLLSEIEPDLMEFIVGMSSTLYTTLAMYKEEDPTINIESILNSIHSVTVRSNAHYGGKVPIEPTH